MLCARVVNCRGTGSWRCELADAWGAAEAPEVLGAAPSTGPLHCPQPTRMTKKLAPTAARNRKATPRAAFPSLFCPMLSRQVYHLHSSRARLGNELHRCTLAPQRKSQATHHRRRPMARACRSGRRHSAASGAPPRVPGGGGPIGHPVGRPTSTLVPRRQRPRARTSAASHKLRRMMR